MKRTRVPVLALLALARAGLAFHAMGVAPEGRCCSGVNRQVPRVPSLRARAAEDEAHVKSVEFLRDGMPHRALGSSDIMVSQVCLGTMTWGQQVDDVSAFKIMDGAVDECGINFLDTSELYPVPATHTKSGETDRIIGRWLKTRSRDDVVISSKIAGFSEHIDWLRHGSEGTRLSKEHIREGVDSALRRLGVDCIDHVEFEWPDRYVPRGEVHTFDGERVRDNAETFESQLEAIGELVKEGKIRTFGVSNETPYGLMRFLEAAKAQGGALPSTMAVQQSYNLLERLHVEGGLDEVCHYGGVSVLGYSPLASGVLTGKYLQSSGTQDEEEYRLNKYLGFSAKYRTAASTTAVHRYKKLAEEYGLTLTQLALSWCYSRKFMTSTVVGVTSLDQLKENVLALNCPMTEEMEREVNAVHHSLVSPTSETLVL